MATQGSRDAGRKSRALLPPKPSRATSPRRGARTSSGKSATSFRRWPGSRSRHRRGLDQVRHVVGRDVDPGGPGLAGQSRRRGCRAFPPTAGTAASNPLRASSQWRLADGALSGGAAWRCIGNRHPTPHSPHHLTAISTPRRCSAGASPLSLRVAVSPARWPRQGQAAIRGSSRARRS